MLLFDWLFGDSKLGWLKTALLSGSLGIVLLTIYNPSWINDEPSGGHYLIIAIGFVPLFLIRGAYWSSRGSRLRRRLIEGDATARAEIDQLAKWNWKVWNELDELVRQQR